MPMYQAQLNRTDFRSFASFAGVYAGPPRPRPPRPPPCAPPPPATAPRPSWAGAAAGSAPRACAMAEDGALIVRTTAIATLVAKIFRRNSMMIPLMHSLRSCLVVRVTGGNLDHASIRHDDGFEEAQRTAVLRRKELHRDLVTGVQGVRSGFADPALRKSRGRAKCQHPIGSRAIRVRDCNRQRTMGMREPHAFDVCAPPKALQNLTGWRRTITPGAAKREFGAVHHSHRIRIHDLMNSVRASLPSAINRSALVGRQHHAVSLGSRHSRHNQPRTSRSRRIVVLVLLHFLIRSDVAARIDLLCKCEAH